MTTTTSDDGWKVPEKQVDTGHVARVRYLSHAIAQRILAIPPDVSKRSRAVRIGKVNEKIRDRANWMSQTYTELHGNRLRITHKTLEDQWFNAYCQAWTEVRASLDAGEDISRFLYPTAD